MYISSIRIENFRSIKYAEIKPSAFNIFVGQNNHGKTNIFEAMEWFYEGSGDLRKMTHMQEEALDFSVEVEFSNIQGGIETVKNQKAQDAFRKFSAGRDVIKVIRRKSEAKLRLSWDEKTRKWASLATFEKAFNDCLPRLEYISTVTRLGDVSKWGKKTPIGLMLSGVLTAVLEKSQQYQEFRAKFEEVFGEGDSDIRASLDDISGKVKIHLEQQFPDCTKVGFEVSAPAFDDILKSFETSINDGIETSAEEKGDGMQRALMLAIIKTYSDYRRDNEELGTRFVFLIDEAELHLHPTAQRQLKNALAVLAENGDQIFINTHSSVLVADNMENQVIFSVVKKNCETKICQTTAQEKPQIVYDLLGGSPSDLLLPQNFLIVEGRSEFEFLTPVIARFYPEKPALQIIFVGGDTEKQRKSMDTINTLFTPLDRTPLYKDRLMILCDLPNAKQQASYDSFLQKFPQLEKNSQIKTLPVYSIEEYYPAPWKKSADEVRSMSFLDKTGLSSQVGKAISLKQFEDEMPEIYSALELAWKKAHQ